MVVKAYFGLGLTTPKRDQVTMGCKAGASGGSGISSVPVGSSGASNSGWGEGSGATQGTDGDGLNPSCVLAGEGVEVVSSGDAQSSEMEESTGPRYGTWRATDGRELKHGGGDVAGDRKAYVDGASG
ncbi:Hypothetical predicted protein [Olea europaea subsp. europaea]|uniref:Uncharacterized protein n=1 Tax=Olea europaea subsp. europaea TaxID=158383 RepID=A0A8S0TVQ2_OLEEU|nr:Hypothetical predicted protein [Olea europaea subsp. europaea]